VDTAVARVKVKMRVITIGDLFRDAVREGFAGNPPWFLCPVWLGHTDEVAAPAGVAF